jgi:hypothetical protein
MACAFAKKCLRYAAAVYLVFAVLGTFAFSAIDESVLDDSSESPLFLVAGDSHIDCLAISPAKDTAPSWRSLPRIIMPQFILAACAGLVCGAVKTAVKKIPKTIKNTIILKLRI